MIPIAVPTTHRPSGWRSWNFAPHELSILSVAEGEGPNDVILTTSGQGAVNYIVSLDLAVTDAISIVGNLIGREGDEVYLETAIALLFLSSFGARVLRYS